MTLQAIAARCSILIMLTTALARPAPAGPTSALPVVHVDWTSGAGCNGTAACPFRTITEAVQHVTASLGGAARIEVAPGVYDVALGEVFPISLPPVVELVAATDCPPIIGGASGVFPPDPLLIPAGSTCALIEGFVFAKQPGQLGYKTAIKVQVASGHLDLTVRDCVIAASTNAIQLTASAGSLSVEVVDSRMTALRAIRLDNASATVDLAVRRCGVAASPRGISIEGSAAGTTKVMVDRTWFAECGVRGIGYFGGNATVDVTHCVFYECGKMAFPSGAAIQDLSAAGASWFLANTIFLGNADQLTGALGAQVIACVLQSTYPGAVASIVADPAFIDPEAYDFHLAPGSPAIDAGLPLLTRSVDIDLDPPGAGAGPDIGVDEAWTPYLTIEPRPLGVFQSAAVTITGPPTAPVWLVVSGGAVATFGVGYLMLPPLLVVPLGTLPATGYLSLGMPPVHDLSLIGTTIAAQAAVVSAPNAITWSRDAVEITFCP